MSKIWQECKDFEILKTKDRGWIGSESQIRLLTLSDIWRKWYLVIESEVEYKGKVKAVKKCELTFPISKWRRWWTTFSVLRWGLSQIKKIQNMVIWIFHTEHKEAAEGEVLSSIVLSFFFKPQIVTLMSSLVNRKRNLAHVYCQRCCFPSLEILALLRKASKFLFPLHH